MVNGLPQTYLYFWNWLTNPVKKKINSYTERIIYTENNLKASPELGFTINLLLIYITRVTLSHMMHTLLLLS